MFLDGLVDESWDSTEEGDSQELFDDLTQRLGRLLARPLSRGTVPLLTGFFGPMPGSLLSTVGRGYSDLLAALAAAAVPAQELWLWKEVDGVHTADPRLVPRARPLRRISMLEAAELTFYGSQVIHPLTMDTVMRHSRES